MKNIWLILGLLIIVLFACKTPKFGTGECDMEGEVVNLSGSLDGCTYMIRAANGEYFQPATLELGEFGYEDFIGSRRIKFAYRENNEMMSACMKGKMVDITCLQVLEEGSPRGIDEEMLEKEAQLKSTRNEAKSRTAIEDANNGTNNSLKDTKTDSSNDNDSNDIRSVKKIRRDTLPNGKKDDGGK